jgi:hypothetical protein
VPTPSIDGSLCDWRDIAETYEWDVLLLGNGLSINVWDGFRYGKLFDHAGNAGLTPDDLALFSGAPNFERILADLNTAIRVAEVKGVDPRAFYESYRRIQLALGHAIRQVHPHRIQVPGSTLAAIRPELASYEWVFTTSYDLIVYWAMGYGERYRPFVDLFRGNGLTFNPRGAAVMEGEVPVYFLHGALHLMVGGTGVTWKLRRNALQTLLDQFGSPVPGDPQARPLLVTEGSAREKLRAIEGNDYLSHALRRLRDPDLELPLVVFGSRLGSEDQHLVDALNENSGRPVAVSIYPGTPHEVRKQQGDIYGRLEANDLLFFDSTTHPLGKRDLRPPRP